MLYAKLVKFFSGCSTQQQGVFPWIVAVVIFISALLIAKMFDTLLISFAYVIFYPAVAGTALFCGWLQAAIAVVLSALAGAYFSVNSRHAIEPKDALPIIAFVVGGGFVVLIVTAMCEAFRRADAAAAARETLFAELQHRVANNLQLVVNLLRMAQRNIQKPSVAADTLDQAEHRIMKMSQMHRQLYSGAPFDRGLEVGLREIIESTLDGCPVEILVSVEHSPNLSVEKMAAIAFLVNEAALNALKHVFSKKLGSRFEVRLSRAAEGHMHLCIIDDGPGMEPPFKENKHGSLGMGIMKAFANQLGGALTTDGCDGTRLCVDFKESE